MHEPKPDGPVVWERKAVLKRGRANVPGTLTITAKKLAFKPLISGKPLTVLLSKIRTVEEVGRFRKRMCITADGATYVFYIRNVGDVARLLRSLTG
jgi:archaellum component FlaG (FlaF/FlaG flagellin family)